MNNDCPFCGKENPQYSKRRRIVGHNDSEAVHSMQCGSCKVTWELCDYYDEYSEGSAKSKLNMRFFEETS